ncbi:alkaline phosphatase [Sorangium cellulosum]|uniref:Alkaline phosphatase n=1 Tax=Sorangium cellulosum TaxID=56 RepID=A0A4P2PZQ0_SORCE|nr:BREX-6 system phosphatase PglZ [Sorangium cellulosum]AUX22407.1 alkaline phosphatase [Sorangium cellulosum]
MPPADPHAGAASRALAVEITKKVRERGLVVWIDADRQYTALVDALRDGAFGFSYPVVPYRGSYLELMLALEPHGNGLDADHVLVHLPGVNKETVKETPVFELYKAGVVFEKSLGTLVREAAAGAATLEEIDAFVRAPGLSLDRADRWLDDLRAQPRDGITLLLESRGLEDIVLGLVADDPRLRAHLPEHGEQVLEFLEKGLGLGAAFRRYRIGEAELTATAVATLVASWLMAVEFVHDLKEPPVTPELAALTQLGPLAKDCRRLAARLREQHADVYELFANELQEHLLHERTSHHAGALGSIDTFRFEEATMRAAALGALRRGDWDAAGEMALARTPEACFWVRRSPALQRTWEILRQAASAGRALAATRKGLDRCGSLDEAVERYAEKLAPVDRQHRLFEQRAHALLASDLDDYDALLEVRKAVRRAYRGWADAINRAFFALCVAHGPLPGRGLRQRTVYEEVVHPLVEQGGRVAYLLVDALRFEMAQGLAQELQRERFRASLGARLAELPTETAIGMNALAPVERNGRLRPVVTKDDRLEGFFAGEFRVCLPADRLRAMSQRSLSGPGLCAEDLELEELQDMTLAQLRRRLGGKPRLVVVRSRELDTAGEHGLHLGTFDHTLALLKSAISLLSQAGVERFVIASDHGFLLQDATAENIPFGASKRAPERRHALLREPSGMPDVLEIRLSALEYDVEEDLHLVLRPDTALWQTKGKIAPFAHGGNSLQERVIPVLVLDRQVARGKTTSRYEVVAHPEPAHLGRQRLRVAVRLQSRENASLGFLAPKSISLALRVPGRPDVSIGLLDAGPPATLADGRVLVPPNRDEAVVEFELEGQADEKVRVEVYHPDAVEEVTSKVVEGFFDVARSRHLPKLRGAAGSAPPPPGAGTAASPVPAPGAGTAASPVPAPGAGTAASPVPAPGRARPASDPAPAQPAPATPVWGELVTDDAYRRVLEIIAERRTINEAELTQVLGSPRRVRAFARHFDELVRRLPFEVEVLTVHGMKAYARKD